MLRNGAFAALSQDEPALLNTRSVYLVWALLGTREYSSPGLAEASSLTMTDARCRAEALAGRG
jgi:hypothetical protein